MLSQAKQVVLLAQRREVFVVHTDEKLTACVELERAIHELAVYCRKTFTTL
ncbi:MAG TPA: hypothetical protein VN825_09205 [Candidatus Acidoferrum sp.]|nr:hypothetical protein [Candidatus Acidoferrum sp.]